MDPKNFGAEIRTFKTFFDRSTACLVEEDSGFTPVEGLMTVAQQVAHVAQTVEWFFAGAFSPGGFDMDFEKLGGETMKVTSLSVARDWLDRAFAAAERTALEHSAEQWAEPLPKGPIMGDMPRFAVIGGTNDHTAHHRGVLTVYSRLRGHVPAMPYM